MTNEELQKLAASLKKELALIDKELRSVANENPMVRGDFDVRVEDIGSSTDDTAQEASELDRLQALVDGLERRRKEIVNTLRTIEADTYGKCASCSREIEPARLKAMPTAALCIKCADKKTY